MQSNIENEFEMVTPLMKAAASGFIEHVKLILTNRVAIDSTSSTGNTALMYACAGGYMEIVIELLKNGANIHIVNLDGHTALMEAASAGHVMVVKILLTNGAKINTYSNDFKKSALTLACYEGHLLMVKVLLEAGAGSGQDYNTNELFTALMEATDGGHLEVSRILLDSGAQVNMKTESLDTPLSLASFGGNVDLGLLFIEHGANIEEFNDEGYTPLMEAVERGHLDMVSTLLIKGAKVNELNKQTQETALTLACSNGYLNIVDVLIKNGANLELGAVTPLLEATREGHIDLIKYLLQNDANKHVQTITIDTAFVFACENGHTHIVDLYLQLGANLEQVTENGRTPLMIACRAGHLSTVKFLISRNAKINRATPNNEHTPLSLACNGGHIQIVKLLLEYSADPFHILQDNSNLVIEAAKGGHTNIIKLILEQVGSVDKSTLFEVIPRIHNIASNIVECHENIAKNNTSCTQNTILEKTKLNIVTFNDIQSKINTLGKTNIKDSDCMPKVFTNLTKQQIKKDLLKKSHHSTTESSLINNPFQEAHEKINNITKIGLQHKSEIIKRCSGNDFDEELPSPMGKNNLSEGLSIKDNKMPDAVETNIIPLSKVLQNSLPKNSIIDPLFFEDKLKLSSNDEKITKEVQSIGIDNFAAVSQSSRCYSSNNRESYVDNVGISNSINVNSQTESSHDTALTIACAGGHQEAVKFLLVCGANIDHITKKGVTSLIISTKRGYENIVQILLNNKANIEAQSVLTKDTPLLLACSLGHYKICKLLIERGANKEHRNISDNTPLNLAAASGFIDIVCLLLYYGANINPQTSSMLGISPLMLATKKNYKNIVKILLTMGCDVNAQIKTNGNTALTIACTLNRDEIVALLLDSEANVNYCNKNKLTYLMNVASIGNVEIGRMLIHKGADINNYSYGDTALTIAADRGHVKFVELLLEKNAHVELKNKKGQSPLWIAANRGHLDIIKLLYRFKANVNSQDNNGITCIMAALQKCHINVVSWMVNYVSQIPSNNEMIQYFISSQNKEMADKCFDCMVIIRRERLTNNRNQ